MTTKAHYTSTATYTPASGVTKGRVTVAGGAGASGWNGAGKSDGGLGAILEALVSLSGPVTVAPGSRAGGAAGSGYQGQNAGAGGAASVFGDIVAGAGGGGPSYFGAGGNGGVPGADAPAGGGTGGGAGGGAAGTGGAGGTGSAQSGSAGSANASGGAGGKGGTYTGTGSAGGGGGGGFGGGGGGTAGNFATGAGAGGGGSSSGGSAGATLVGYNSGVPYVDVEVAGVPKVPTLLTPVGNAWADRTSPIVLAFQHNGDSADSLDAQSDAQVRHRKVGTSTWTTVTSLGTATSYSIPANTYDDNDQVEWQASTWSDGLQGPWSDSALFTAATPPDTPVITAPSDSSTLGTAAIVIAWTHDGQVAYQARVVNDVGGSAPAQPIVYADSGPVASTDLTTTLTVKVNEVDAHVQVRARDIAGGLWSQWADVAISISWEPPPTPEAFQRPDPEHGSIVIVITNPTPEGVQPAPTVNRIYITENNVEKDRVEIAPGTDWEYWTPVGEIAVRVEAVDESTGVSSSTEVIW